MQQHKDITGSSLHNSRIDRIAGNPTMLHHPSTASGETVIDSTTNTLYTSIVVDSVVTWISMTSSRNIDGGASDSIYLPSQHVDGGTP